MRPDFITLVILLFLLILPISCAVNPVTHRYQLCLMGESEEIRIGEKLYPVYTQMSYGLFQDKRLQEYVQKVGQRLALVSHRPYLDYQFNVVNDSALNAYALPGGKISITRGLLAKLQNEAQLAAVLGHEIGHVAARHQATAYTRRVFTELLTTAGVVFLQSANIHSSDLISRGTRLAAELVLMKYSRDQERQADELGIEYMVRAGYNPLGFIQVMEMLMAEHKRKPSGLERFFSDHPMTKERLKAAKQQLASYDFRILETGRLGGAQFQRATCHLRKVLPAYEKMDKALRLLEVDHTTKAVKLLRKATAEASSEALIWVHRAVAESACGQRKKAMSSALRAVSLYPDLFYARYAAGVTTYDNSFYRVSLDHLRIANQLVPEQPQVVFYMGRDLEALGEIEEAAKAYTIVIKKVKRGPMVRYCCARLVEWGYLFPVISGCRY